MSEAPTHTRLDKGLPALCHVLRTYMIPGRDEEFILEWRQSGGDSPTSSRQFQGLTSDLDAAIDHPEQAADILNPIIDPAEPWAAETIRDLLVRLSDQLHERGPYAPAAQYAAMSEGEKFSAWSTRRTPMPSQFSHIDIPLWQVAAGSLAVAVTGALITIYIPYGAIPGLLLMLPALFVFAFAIFAMLTVRDQVIHPDREAKRKAREELARQRRDARRASGRLFGR